MSRVSCNSYRHGPNSTLKIVQATSRPHALSKEDPLRGTDVVSTELITGQFPAP